MIKIITRNLWISECLIYFTSCSEHWSRPSDAILVRHGSLNKDPHTTCPICEQGLYDDHRISEKWSEVSLRNIPGIDPLKKKIFIFWTNPIITYQLWNKDTICRGFWTITTEVWKIDYREIKVITLVVESCEKFTILIKLRMVQILTLLWESVVSLISSSFG